MGGATYARAIQNEIEDFKSARAINHIRNWYLTLHPDAQSLLLLSTDETPDGVMQGVRNPKWQTLFTTAGVVAFVMSVLIGVTVALASAAAFGLTIYAATAVGLGAGSVGEVSLIRHHMSRWREATS